MNATGAEIIAFYKAWPIGGDFYHDDGIVYVDEGDQICGIDSSKEYDVDEAIGYLVWQGQGKVPPKVVVNKVDIFIPKNWTGPKASEVFSAWRGDARPMTVLLEPHQVEGFRQLCAAHAWNLLT